MKTLNKTLIALSLAAALPTAALAVHVPLLDVVFDPTAVAFPSAVAPLTPAFTFDEIVFSSVGASTLTVTDTGNGMLTVGGTDTFTEAGLVVNANFKKDGFLLPPGMTGVNFTYQMFAIFDTALIAGTGLAGTVGLTAGGNVEALFTPGLTAAKIVFDTGALNGVYDPASSSTIGTLTLGTGSCLLTPAAGGGGFAEGSCGLTFSFDAAGVTDAGVWTRGGIDLGLLKASITLDVDVDTIAPPLTVAFSGGAGSSQVANVIHDGSTSFQVPEPASLALLGIGLLGMGGLLRRRRAA